MPTVTFHGHRVQCEIGANLRRVLMDAELPLYHKISRVIHCRGLGTCGTCAVKLRGSVSWPTKIEQLRLSTPPHHPHSGLRLACQCLVHGDLTVEKFDGIWGHRLDRPVVCRKRAGTIRQRPPAREPISIQKDLVSQPSRRRVPSLHRLRRAVKSVYRRLPAMPDASRLRTDNLRFQFRFCERRR